MSQKKIYIAGPMRGKPDYNYAAFAEAEETLDAAGHDAKLPVCIYHLKYGNKEITEDAMCHKMLTDLAMIEQCDAIALLPGWGNSKGVAAELAFAEAIGGKDTYIYSEGVLSKEAVKVAPCKSVEDHQSILVEAEAITDGDRQDDYGHPYDEHAKIAELWSPILDVEVTPLQVNYCMIQLKIARNLHRPKRDNFVDIAGYAKCGHAIWQRELEQGK